jgi:hypothetical protein
MQLFDRPGPENTDAVLTLAAKRGTELGLRTCVLASNTGRTARRALELMPGFTLVAVTHVTGFREANVQELAAEERSALEGAGVRVVTAAHAFGSLGRAARNKLGTYQIDEYVAYTLRVFGQGTKVAVEVSLMAADAGAVEVGRPIVSVGGTGGGADTAVVLVPANTHNFFDLKVREIICKPGDW